jgi:hypothetical protein
MLVLNLPKPRLYSSVSLPLVWLRIGLEPLNLFRKSNSVALSDRVCFTPNPDKPEIPMTKSQFQNNYSGARSQNSGVRMKSDPAKNFEDLIVWQKAHQFVLSFILASGS